MPFDTNRGSSEVVSHPLQAVGIAGSLNKINHGQTSISHGLALLADQAGDLLMRTRDLADQLGGQIPAGPDGPPPQLDSVTSYVAEISRRMELILQHVRRAQDAM